MKRGVLAFALLSESGAHCPMPVDWTAWTARLAVAAYCGAVLALVGRRASASEPGAARWLWTVAWLTFVVHVLCAFHFAHHWSHAEAWAHTARQTRALTGLDWGGGLLANYAFLAWWALDVAAWWRPARCAWRRNRGYQIALHGVFAFIVINATVVFGPPFWKPAGLAMLLLLATAWWRGRDNVAASERSGPPASGE